MAARPLERALAHVQRLHPHRRDIDPLLHALNPHVAAPLAQPRAAATPHPELEAWAAAPAGLPGALRATLHALVAWSVASAAPPTAAGPAPASAAAAPPQYTHRQLLAAVGAAGAPRVLAALLAEAGRLRAAGAAAPDVLLDVLAALLSAPQAAAPRAGLTLRGALAPLAAQAHALAKDDAAQGALLVRLQRRIEAQVPRPPGEAQQAAVDAGAVQEAAVAAAAEEMVLDGAAAGAGAAGGGAGGDVMMADAAAAAAGGMEMDLEGVLRGGLGGAAGFVPNPDDGMFDM